mmetsp:Transcript_9933/g.18756  ORF Transcript_9933/g.18756 Transcript_9933/m.18756 type:complete len:299 (+) Transcript_9933:572-1468(+)
MPWNDYDLWLSWTICEVHWDFLLGHDGRVSPAHWIYDLLVHGPQLVPLLERNVPTRSLLKDEISKCLDSQASSQQTLHGGEPWIGPAADLPGVHKPLELSLTHHSIHQIQPREFPDVHVGKLGLALLLQLENPLELSVPVVVLGCSQSVRDSLKAVNERARKVVGGVDLVGGSCPVVRREVASVTHRISQRLVWMLHIKLDSDAVLDPFLRAVLHLLEDLQGFLHRPVPSDGVDSFHSLFPHLLHGSVVRVKESLLDHLLCERKQVWKGVRRVGHLVWSHFQALQVRNDVLDKLVLLL